MYLYFKYFFIYVIKKNIKKLLMLTIDQYFSSIYLHISLANLYVQVSFFKHTCTSSFFWRSVIFLIQNHPTFSHTNFTQIISLNGLSSVFFLMKNQTPITEIIKQPKSKQKLYIV